MHNFFQVLLSLKNVFKISLLSVCCLIALVIGDPYNRNDQFQVTLHAPTVAGLAQGAPTLTNLDRSTWYSLSLTSLDTALTDTQMVSINVQINPDTPTEDSLFTSWQILHPLEPLFSLKSNVKVNSEPEPGSSAHNIFWKTPKRELKLEIHFNFASSQFCQELNTFLNVKILSQTTFVVKSYYAQVKLFWPSESVKANQKALVQLMKSSNSHSKLVPSRDTTKLEHYSDVRSALLDFYLLGRLHSNCYFFNETNAKKVEQTRLYYILGNYDAESQFIQNDDRFSGIIIANWAGLFSITLTLDNVASDILTIKTRFELNLDNHQFTKLELDNWQTRNPVHNFLIEPDIVRSQLSGIVFDIRQTALNRVEMFWQPMPKGDKLVITFKLNSVMSKFDNKPFYLKIRSFLQEFTSNGEDSIVELDSALLKVFTSENQKNLKILLQKENKVINPEKLPSQTVPIINEPLFNSYLTIIATAGALVVSLLVCCCLANQDRREQLMIGGPNRRELKW